MAHSDVGRRGSCSRRDAVLRCCDSAPGDQIHLHVRNHSPSTPPCCMTSNGLIDWTKKWYSVRHDGRCQFEHCVIRTRNAAFAAPGAWRNVMNLVKLSIFCDGSYFARLKNRRRFLFSSFLLM